MRSHMVSLSEKTGAINYKCPTHAHLLELQHPADNKCYFSPFYTVIYLLITPETISVALTISGASTLHSASLLDAQPTILTGTSGSIHVVFPKKSCFPNIYLYLVKSLLVTQSPIIKILTVIPVLSFLSRHIQSQIRSCYFYLEKCFSNLGLFLFSCSRYIHSNPCQIYPRQ